MENELLEIIENATTYLLDYAMVKRIIKGYEEKKITKEIAFDYVQRVVKQDASWIKEENAKSLSE